MKVILLGATGYIGSHVAEQIKNAGHELLCLVRASSNLTFLDSINAKSSAVDFKEIQSIEEHFDAGDIVVNCLADTRSHASYEQRKSVEIELTESLFKSAQRNKIASFIQLSTVMAYGFDRPETPINEEYELKPKHIYSLVARDRESVLMKNYQKEKTSLIILRPSNTIGKRDVSFLPNFVNSSKKGVFPTVGGGRWNFSCIDTRDIGRAIVHLLTLETQQPEIYLVKGYDQNWLEFKEALDKFLDKKTVRMNLPKKMMYATGRMMEIIYPFDSNPPLTSFDSEVLSTHTLFDDAKIRKTGFTPKYTLLDSFQDALNA